MFESSLSREVLRLAAPGARWLSTGWDGGFRMADAGYVISVPDDWHRTDLETYVGERRTRAGFDTPGPSLLTAVELTHARGATLDAVEVYATVGLSNPAALPMAPSERAPHGSDTDMPGRAGTVNLVIGTSERLTDAGMANLLTVAAEAKAATLVADTGFPGTTSDAIAVACDPDGDTHRFTGSATPIGAATRACIRDAVQAGLAAAYPDGEVPSSVADAEHGVVTTREADVFRV